MGFEEKLGISKKSFSILMVAIVLGIVSLTVAAFTLNFAPYAYVGPLPNPGHGGDTVWVDVPASGEMTLQDAITTGVLGGGGVCPSYDSGWFAVTGSDVLTLNHNLGTTSIFIEIFWAPDNGGGPDLSKIGRVETTRWGAGALEMGAQVLEITDSSLKVYLAASYLSDAVYSGSYAPPSGHYKVLAISTACGGGGGASLPDCPTDGQILKYDLPSTSWTCVDEAGGSGGSIAFGAWDKTDSGQIGGTGAVLARETTYRAAGDGFIVAEMIAGHCGQGLEGYTDSAVNPSTLRAQNGSGYIDTGGAAITMPVKANDYWRVKRKRTDGVCNGVVNIYWIPLVDGGGGGASLPDCPADGQILKYDLGSTSWTCVDEAGGAGGSLAFGNWADVTVSASGGAVQGPAVADGFVVIGTDDWGKIDAFTDSDNPPTRRLVYNSRDSVNEKQFTMPVKKGDYWRVSGRDISSVHWIPLIDGGGGGVGESEFGNYEGTITVNSAVPSGSWTNEFAPIQALTDLLLVATVAQTSDSWMVVSWRGYTGTTSNPTDYRAGMGLTDDWGPPYTGSDSFTMFVKKGDYYVVKGRAHIDWATSTRTYSTIPIGS